MSEKEKSTDDKSPPASFDLAQLRELIEMMEEHGVTEVHLRQQGQQWRLKRGPSTVQVPAAAPAAMPMAMPAQPAPAAPAPAAPAAAAPAEADTSGLIEIKSPAVGTFYSSPSPDDPAFVKVGSKVSPETIVCLIEAMKVFNQIPAECSGIIEKVLVKDGDAIDFGQPLFLAKPA